MAGLEDGKGIAGGGRNTATGASLDKLGHRRCREQDGECGCVC